MLIQLRDTLRKRYAGCEFYGRKIDSPPWWIPCALRESNVEDCMFHKTVVLRIQDCGGYEVAKKYNVI